MTYQQLQTQFHQCIAKGDHKAAHGLVLMMIESTDDFFALEGLRATRERLLPHLPKPHPLAFLKMFKRGQVA